MYRSSGRSSAAVLLLLAAAVRISRFFSSHLLHMLSTEVAQSQLIAAHAMLQLHSRAVYISTV
jgi:hypothetical protein